MMLIFLLIVGVLVYYLMNGHLTMPQQKTNKADDILKERFVTGEIDEPTYLQMKETLKK